MSDQPNKSDGGNPSGNNNNNQRRNNNRRRHNKTLPRDNAQSGGQGQNNNGPRPQNAQGQNNNGPRPQNNNGPRPQNAQGQGGQNNNQRRRPHHNNNNNQNRPRQPQHQNLGLAPNSQLDRTYEKYLNLLDQHLIARRKYHDMFYRAEGAQKAKLEKNFYNTLNDVREFENRLTPEMRTQFEKRNNGYQLDHTYTTNHEISIEGDAVPSDLPPAEPHYLQSQMAADYSNDTEESVGTAEDYLRYKGM